MKNAILTILLFLISGSSIYSQTTSIKISGTIYNDTLPINGTIDKQYPLGNPGGQSLCMNLISDSGIVIANASVLADGTYEFTNVDSFKNYSLLLSTTCELINNTVFFPILPPNWANNGEDCCDGIGTDLNDDGILALTVGNTSLSMADFGIIMVTTGVFPVEFIEFNLIESNCNVLVSWATVQEQNILYFDIMRRIEGRNDFEKIASVKPAGNSVIKKTYSYLDKDKSQSDKMHQYRIKVTDIDGSYEYSKIKSLNLSCDDNNSAATIFPNPVENTLNLVYNADNNDENLIIDILDITGRKVSSTAQIVFQGRTTIDINTEILAAGQYFLRYKSEGNNSNVLLKFTKQ